MKAGLPKFLFVLLALPLGAFALRHMSAVRSHPYPIEYGEGVNLLWARQAAEGNSLYPDVPEDRLPQLHNPYPPVFPLLSHLLATLGADAHAFSAGRTLSLWGMMMSAWGLFSLLRRRTGDGFAFCGLLIFFLSPVMLRFGPMMRVDSLALGYALLALDQLDRERWKSSALLAALAFCVKPSFLSAALVVAVTVLSSRNPRRILSTALCGMLLPAVLLTGMLLQKESHVFLHLVTLQRLPPDLPGAFSWLARFAGFHAPLLTLSVFALHRADRMFKGYAVAAVIPLLLTFGISGSQENYLMELWAAVCLTGICGLAVWKKDHPRAVWTLLLLQLILFLPVSPAPVFTRTYGQEIPAGQSAILTPSASDLEIGTLLQAEFETLPGPVLSADPGVVLASGHRIVYQPFQFEKLSAAGSWSAESLHHALRTSEFSAVLLKGLAETSGDPTFHPDTQQLIHQHYTLHRVLGPWHLYRRP